MIVMKMIVMIEKKYPFPKQTGTLQKHNFNNKLYLIMARKC